VEIWPAHEEIAFRVELFGDEIDRLSVINPLTGVVLQVSEELFIYPAKHFVTPEERIKEAVAGISNELFFTNREPYFERNRILMGLNYKYSKNLMLQLGYLHQFDYRINDETGRDFLVVGLYFELYKRKNTPSAQDAELQDN
jgi:excinuclease ABC subunit B